ncbi:MAG: hypothetical protein VKK97_10965 [Synechococcaceae cyanobacterium]|nr:hypothetical protein [Synechococcaceae cyanobacterium]
MRWITEEQAPSGEWELIGGPYKTLPLAKRCARQRLQIILEEKQPLAKFRISTTDGASSSGNVVVLESAGLQGGWRLIWEPTAVARRRDLARRRAPMGEKALRDLAQHHGDSNPFAQATGLKWGFWSLEEAADQVLASPTLTPEQLHAGWVGQMEAQGWSAGPELDVEAKEHPSLVAHQYLTSDEQVYDVVFVSAVRRVGEILQAAA